jgi:hypothetical protein
VSDAQEPPEPPGSVRWARSRLPFDPEASPLKGAPGAGGALIFAAAAVALAGVALYMGLALRHPLTSAYVMAPAVGAAWFAMRCALKLGSRKGS